MNFINTHFEDKIIRTNTKKVIKYYMEQHLLISEKRCDICDESMYLKFSRQYIDKYALMCLNIIRIVCGNRTSIHKDSFYEGFKIN